ncbi:hypothetical protein KO481_13085 [Nocardia sp. NEAU-G5]|uniref:HNH endonuclease n=1 Tax=Nocardia albiluteola TaxID=2842303 RepID=A0ABS6AX37_9NOCA|nr:hypothetical protein [Nocardia albiluteola]MBU3062453.1 hypothetical protein [Nocardia albiluteola]
MNKRDDFSPGDKERMARRVGYRCSAPSCRAATAGPTVDPDGSSNLGVASHITAAAEGGPRYDASLTVKERKSLANGIWLCQIHAKQIDDDLQRFPTDLLRGWKTLAEARARSEHGVPDSYEPPMALPPKSLLVQFDGDYDSLHEKIEEFREDTGIARAWSPATDEKIHYLLYELTINAFEHGRARKVELKSQDFGIQLSFRGARFGISDLLASECHGGGTAALEAFRNEEAGRLEVVHHWDRGLNTWNIVDFTRDDSQYFPCSAHWGNLRSSEVFETCSEVHIYLPRYFAMSDSRRFPEELEGCLMRKQLVVHGAAKWEALRNYLAAKFPHARFVP